MKTLCVLNLFTRHAKRPLFDSIAQTRPRRLAAMEDYVEPEPEPKLRSQVFGRDIVNQARSSYALRIPQGELSCHRCGNKIMASRFQKRVQRRSEYEQGQALVHI